MCRIISQSLTEIRHLSVSTHQKPADSGSPGFEFVIPALKEHARQKQKLTWRLANSKEEKKRHVFSMGYDGTLQL